MNAKEAEQQIAQMVEFIRQEAKEKEEEIQVKTEEEYNIQKLNLIVASKVKIREEFKKKEEALSIKNRIARSKKFNEARMEKMKMRDQVVMKCKNAAIEQLGEVSSHARYPELLKGLIAQGLLRLMEPKVNIQCRAEDIKLVNAALAPAVALYVKTMKDRANMDVKVDITISERSLPAGPSKQNKDGVSCAGGIVLLGLDNRIAVDNTLDARVDLAFEQLKPKIRELLFGKRPAPIREAYKPAEHHH